jgi:hypothetical protein
MKQIDKSPYAKTQPFGHRRIRAASSRSTSSLPRAGRLAAQAESLERFQESLARPAMPEFWPRMTSVDSQVAWTSRLESAVFVVARWITVWTVVLAIHWAAAKYVFLL